MGSSVKPSSKALQLSPDLAVEETVNVTCSAPLSTLLQLSPDLAVEETLGVRAVKVRRGTASIEPRPRGRGNMANHGRSSASIELLQLSPDLAVEETPPAGGIAVVSCSLQLSPDLAVEETRQPTHRRRPRSQGASIEPRPRGRGNRPPCPSPRRRW